MYVVPFNRPVTLDNHLLSVKEAVDRGHLSTGGHFVRLCEEGLTALMNGVSARLVTSATDALELTALLLRVELGDEVIVPSYTFVSTANAFALRGARIRFADNDEYGNIRPSEIERLLSPHTRAVVVVHYGGASCDMETVMAICHHAGVPVVEDAAQAIGSLYRGRPLGTFGELGCLSFHETKNVTSGEGGALLIGASRHVESAAIAIDKGTDRARFAQGLRDKYTWVGLGSSYGLSELNAAYLHPQLAQLDTIRETRRSIRARYTDALADALASKGIRILSHPSYNTPNHHLMALVMPDRKTRDHFIASMKDLGICCPFHYVPLHSSPFGARYVDHAPESLPGAERLADTIVRLPLFFNMADGELAATIDAVRAWLRTR